jgi:hypothetical protein
MSGEINCPCLVQQSTLFVFNTVQVQLAANAVYEYKKAYDAAQAAAGKNTVYQFKSDWERMQYLTGKLGRVCNLPTVGSGNS